MMGSLVWMIACPVGMAAMGGIAWGLSRLPGRRAQRLASLSSRATCMPMGAGRQPVAADQRTTPEIDADAKVPAGV